ncbi:MAG: hypothetical protein ACREPM_19275, partial [Gemmatimonadaceae bacterium]
MSSMDASLTTRSSASGSPRSSTYAVSSQQAQRDANDAGRLLAYGLAVSGTRARSFTNEPELVSLVQQYHSSAAFREIVKAIAAGLRLQVVEVDAKGVVLMPMTDSPFALDPGTLRNSSKADDRLLDGLIMIAIAATVYPRPATLDEDTSFARPPITAQNVEHTLRDLCDRLAADAQSEGDPTLSDVRAGLIEAWRVYQRRPSVRKTADDRRATRTTLAMVERNLESLRENGCFFRVTRPEFDDAGEETLYQPTWRFQVQMQEFSAS